jgi:uncharacterized protein YbcI
MEQQTVEARMQRTDSLARDISRVVVGLFKDRFGRGPTVAKTYFNDDLVVCVLGDTMTRAEKALVAEGRADEVRQLRDSFLPSLLREHATGAVEELVGRRVIAFLGDHAVDPDWAVGCFVLEPASGDNAAPRSDSRLPPKTRS